MTASDPRRARDDLAADLIVSAARLVRFVRRHSETEETTATWRALAILDELGPTRVSDVAAVDQLSQPTATAMMRRLVEEGSVTRVPDPDDGRARLLDLTDAGRARLARLRAAGVAVLGPALDEFTPAERTALRQAIDVLGRITAPPRPRTERTSE